MRETYLDPASSEHITAIKSDLVDLSEVHVRVKVGTEGASVFDSATALLQGLFPPNPKNRITLANGSVVGNAIWDRSYTTVAPIDAASGAVRLYRKPENNRGVNSPEAVFSLFVGS